MPLPTAYTELTLSEYMLNVTKGVANAIKFQVNDFAEAVNDTLIAYGVDTIAEADDMTKLRSLARVCAWQALVTATSGEFDYSADSGETATYYKRNQLHDNAKKALAKAEAEATQAGYLSVGDGAMTSSVASVTHTW